MTGVTGATLTFQIFVTAGHIISTPDTYYRFQRREDLLFGDIF